MIFSFVSIYVAELQFCSKIRARARARTRARIKFQENFIN